jgi:hypothetical protein
LNINFLGVVPTPNDLPDPGQNQGDAYLVTSTGTIFVWTGSQWVDAGPIQGATGPPGPPGEDGKDADLPVAGSNGLWLTSVNGVPVWQGLSVADVANAQSTAQKGQPNGYAPLDASGQVPVANLPIAAIALTGEIRGYGGATAPNGWLLMNGASYPRATYPQLAQVLDPGGAGPNFTVPDARDRALFGAGNQIALWANDGMALGQRGATHNHSFSLTMPAHSHTVNDPTHVHGPQGYGGPSDPGNTGLFYRDTYGDNFIASGSGMALVRTGIPAASTGVTINQQAATAITGTVGPASTPANGPGFLGINYIIKT